MVELTFTNPGYLWILLLIPVLMVIHFLTLKQNRTAVIKFSNFEAMERVAKGDSLGSPYRGYLKNKNIGLLAMRACIYCLLILSAAGTTIWYVGKTSNFDYVLAIDSSSSMLANDIAPTRFDAAKEAAGKFLDAAPPGAKIGILTFASTSIIEQQPSDKLDEVRNALSSIGLQETGGTTIGDAIVTSVNMFNTNKSKSIVLLTDGQSNVGIDPYVAMDYAKKNDVTVHTIGVATKEGGNISGLNFISKIDESLLQKISQETNGISIVAENSTSLNEAFIKIASVNEKLLSLNISWILLVSAIVLLGLEWVLINTVYKTIP